MSYKLAPEEAWVVEVCVAGRDDIGPWRAEFTAIEDVANRRALEWNACRPAGYSHRAVRYVQASVLAASQKIVRRRRVSKKENAT